MVEIKEKEIVKELTDISGIKGTELKIGEATKRITDKRELAKEFLEIQPIHYDKSKLWWVWNFKDFCWLIVDETDILNKVAEACDVNVINSRERNEILEAIKQISRLNKPKPSKNTWIQFKNKIIDIETNETFEASPKYFITNPIPQEIGESEETPNMDRIFEQWVGKDYVQTLYEIISYCLLPDYPIHRLFCLFGEGLNGKSKYLELVNRFIGLENITTTELDRLLESRFEITNLYKKLVCIMGETNFSEMRKTSVLKRLTGQDLIGYEYKGKNPFQDYNYAKILISTNNIPPSDDKTIGFLRRWCIIDFPNRFSEKKDILGEIPEEEYSNLASKCIKILKNLLKKREFHNEGSIEERGLKYEEKSNPFEKFWKERIEEDTEKHIFKFEFKKELESWCKENHFRVLSDVVLAKNMKEKGIETEKISADWYSKEGIKKRYNAWVSINWKFVSRRQDCHPKSHSILRVCKTSRVSTDRGDSGDTLKVEEETVEK